MVITLQAFKDHKPTYWPTYLRNNSFYPQIHERKHKLQSGQDITWLVFDNTARKNGNSLEGIWNCILLVVMYMSYKKYSIQWYNNMHYEKLHMNYSHSCIRPSRNFLSFPFLETLTASEFLKQPNTKWNIIMYARKGADLYKYLYHPRGIIDRIAVGIKNTGYLYQQILELILSVYVCVKCPLWLCIGKLEQTLCQWLRTDC